MRARKSVMAWVQLVAGFGSRTPGKAGRLRRSGDVAEGISPFLGEVGCVDEPRPFVLISVLDVGEYGLGLGDGVRSVAGFAEGGVGPGL
jgi:hypothetical protein